MTFPDPSHTTFHEHLETLRAERREGYSSGWKDAIRTILLVLVALVLIISLIFILCLVV